LQSIDNVSKKQQARARLCEIAVQALSVTGFCAVAAIAAHAQSDPFTNNATTWQSTFCGPLAKTLVVIGAVLIGAPMALNKPGDHKQGFINLGVGGSLVLGAQTVITTFFNN
jgi:type IV secretory pathway VirB2 component (pilin)